MTDHNEDVKRGWFARGQSWIDCHPRTGWYVAIWVTVVTLNTFWDIVSGLVRWVTGI